MNDECACGKHVLRIVVPIDRCHVLAKMEQKPISQNIRRHADLTMLAIRNTISKILEFIDLL